MNGMVDSQSARDLCADGNKCKPALPIFENTANATTPNVQKLPNLDSILDSSETFSRDAEFEVEPTGLSHVIWQLCKEYKVDNPVWAPSPTNCKEIYILGRGAERIYSQLVEETRSRFPGFTFITKNCGPLYTKHYCANFLTVHKKAIVEEADEWRDLAQATCELILKGTEKNRDDNPSEQAMYAVVPAHLTLNETQCLQLAETINPQELDEVRGEVNSQIAKTRYTLKINQMDHDTRRLDLKPPAMISYRHSYTKLSTPTDDTDYRCPAGTCTADQLETCPHTYMNDIAIHLIAPNSAVRLQHRFLQDARFSSKVFGSVLPPSVRHIARMIRERTRLYIRDLECHLVQSLDNPEPADPAQDAEERKYGIHVAFTIPQRRNALAEGDSGCILHMKHGNQRIAIAMFVGESEVPDAYQAVLLGPALKDIEIAYRHHVEGLSPFLI